VLAKYIKSRNLPYCPFEPTAKAGSTKARENIQNFIDWAQCLGLSSPAIFSVEDLTTLRDQRRIIYGLFDVARRTRMLRVPRLVWLERLNYMPNPKSVKRALVGSRGRQKHCRRG
jgi:hypothetical protein